MYLLIKKSVIITILCNILFSCSGNDLNLDRVGKLSFYNSFSSKSFSFTVSNHFATDGKPDQSDKKYPIMSKSEVKLLKSLLKKNNYCINNKNKLSFEVTSKQEKIYDVTFSGIIEQEYNARSLTPVTYFGKCL